MRNLNVKIIREIKQIKKSNYFVSRIYNRGVEYYLDHRVESVEVINEDLVRALVRGRNTYDVVIGLDEKAELYLDCDCAYEHNCKHLAAVLEYVKSNYLELEMEYIIGSPNYSRVEVVNYLLSLYNQYHGLFYWLKSSEEKFENIEKLLVKNTICLINEDKTKLSYNLFFNVIIAFNKAGVFLVEDKYLELIKELKGLFINHNSNFLEVWQRVCLTITFDYFYDYIEETEKLILDHEQAKSYREFLELTLGFFRTYKFYCEDDQAKNLKRSEYIKKLSFLIAKILVKFFNSSADLEVLKDLAGLSEEIEELYLIKLLELKDKSLVEYLETTENLGFLGKLLNLRFKYKENSIKLQDLKQNILKLFEVNSALKNFKYIHKYLDVEIFSEIKDPLLNMAKENDLETYYNLEIYLDEEQAYQLIKDAGIHILNKFVDYFLDKYEEDIVLYYQEQLVEIFSKNKQRGVLHTKAIAAIRKLGKMKNGKYYIYSIYRLAKANVGLYELTTPLEDLYDLMIDFEL